MLKLFDSSAPEASPAFNIHAPAVGLAGVLVDFHASAANHDAPVLEYHWEFGDGVSADGAEVHHAYTYASQYTVRVTAEGLNGHTAQNSAGISITGTIPTGYKPAEKTRYSEMK
jgi:PKD repeat protein